MKLLKHEYLLDEGCSQVEVEKQFLWFKRKATYRLKDGSIMGYSHLNKYRVLGLGEWISARELFKMPVTK